MRRKEDENMMNTCRLTFSRVGQVEGLQLMLFQETEFKLAVNIRVLTARGKNSSLQPEKCLFRTKI